MPLTLGAKLDAGALQAQVDAILHRRTGGARDTLIQNPGPPPNWDAANLAIAAAQAHFQTLEYWKRARWTICAYKKGIPADAPIGHAGWSGKQLYVRCYFEQKITPPNHPISPCSRRMTSGSASPWDYTP